MDVWCSLKSMIFALALVAGIFSTSDFEGEKTTYESCNENYFCFSLKNESFKSSNIYTFNYTGIDCGTDDTLFSSWKPCHKDNETNNIKCLDRNLIPCNSKGLTFCTLQINVRINDTGRTTKIFSLSRWLSLDVKKSLVQVKEIDAVAKSATEVAVTWSRPECRNLEYSYRWSYTAGSNSKKQFEETLADSPETIGKTHTKMFDSLRPFTKYKICVEPRVKYRQNFEPATCDDVKTLEAVPSKAPRLKKLTPVLASKTQWQCEVQWEPVETEYLNGNVNSTSIEFYDENERQKLAVPKISVPFGKSSHVVKGLSVNAGYFAKLSICNKAGCNSSEQKYISINHQAEKNNLWIYMTIPAGIIVFLVIVITVVSVVISKRRLRKTVSTNSLLPRVVVPRPEEINPQVCDENEDDHQYARAELFQANPNQDVFENGAEGQIEGIEGEAGHMYELVSGETPPSMVTLNDDNDDVLNDDQLNNDGLSFSERVSFYSQPEDSESSTIRTYSFETDPLMPCGAYET